MLYCIYKNYGCAEKLLKKDMKDHELQCPYKVLVKIMMVISDLETKINTKESKTHSNDRFKEINTEITCIKEKYEKLKTLIKK